MFVIGMIGRDWYVILLKLISRVIERFCLNVLRQKCLLNIIVGYAFELFL